MVVGQLNIKKTTSFTDFSSRYIAKQDLTPALRRGRPAGGMMWAGLANSYYWVDQTNGLAGVYITQIFPFADIKSLPLFYDFEKAVYDAR